MVDRRDSAKRSADRPLAKKASSKQKPKAQAQSPKQEGRLTPLQERFLKIVSQSANITQAAELAGIDRSNHYRWLESPKYRRAFLEARESALDRLELEAWKRAMAGSDRLLIFLLSSYRARFRQDNQPPGPVMHELMQMDDQELLTVAQQELRQLGYENLEDLWSKVEG